METIIKVVFSMLFTIGVMVYFSIKANRDQIKAMKSDGCSERFIKELMNK